MTAPALKAETNAVEWSVSELSNALKRTLEDTFGFVRLRGEISGYRGPHASGHGYFSLKDEGSKIDAVVWRGTFSKLKFKPEEGAEVIATGRITTFPGKSSYQIVVEALEPAGVGALLAQLEKRRLKLAAEGLFDAERKRALPYLPGVIGVVTSPTGAVIRDILHRLADRFPRRVLVWPARVQGETSAAEVAAGIRGFNALAPGGPIPRPDVIIVARGGGSIEDLWGFNDEALVRAAAESAIPLVSAVGHETDWTLIDHVADVRAPTPTGAAEMVVPVRAELAAAVGDLARRHGEAMLRGVERRRTDLRALLRALPRADALLARPRQRLDLADAQLKPALVRGVQTSQLRLADIVRKLAAASPRLEIARLKARLGAIGDRPGVALARHVVIKRDGLPQIEVRLRRARDADLERRRQRLHDLGHRLGTGRATLLRQERLRLAAHRERLAGVAERLPAGLSAQVARRGADLGRLAQLLASLSYRSVLARGFALVRDADGAPLRAAASVVPGQALALEFADGPVRVTADGLAPGRTDEPARPAEAPRPRRRAGVDGTVGQGSLFDA